MPVCNPNSFGACPSGFTCNLANGRYSCIESVTSTSILMIVIANILLIALIVGIGSVLGTRDTNFVWVAK